MAQYSITTLRIYEAGADPDSLFYLEDYGGADYQELGFPPQGLANRLCRDGLIVRDSKTPKSRTNWVPGPAYQRWRRHYQENRIAFRTSRNLPLEMDSKIITRMIIKAGCDPDDFLGLTARHVCDMKDLKKQAAQALISMGLLQPIPKTRLLGPGRYYESWARAYPEHRDWLRKSYRLPDRSMPKVAGEAMA